MQESKETSPLPKRAKHGYDLLAEYRRQEVADWASISKAQLYYALKKLEDLGLLKGLVIKDARDRTVFTPTAAGRRALAAGLSDLGWAASRVAQSFLTWLGLSIHAPAAAQRAMLHERPAFLDREIEKERQSLNYIATLTDARALKGGQIVQLTIRQLTVERAWIAEAIKASAAELPR